MYLAQDFKKAKKRINLHQPGFKRGYMSVQADSLMPPDALSDMTNMTMEQDFRPRPRPSLVPWGDEFPGAWLGDGEFIDVVDGSPVHKMIGMFLVGGEAKVYTCQDAMNWVEAGGTNSYDIEATATFTQSNKRVYVSNKSDAMSYLDIETGDIVVYSEISAPNAPALVKAGLAGTDYTYYYKVTANNAVGETEASIAETIQVGKVRDGLDITVDSVTLSWAAVTGATSYNVYVGTQAGSEQFLVNVNGTTFKDDSSIASSPFKIAPQGNSTAGPILGYLVNRNGQLFGCNDKDNPYYLWYSGTGENSGDFSPFNGGGFVAINYGGDSVPVAVRSFRDGKGTPAATILTKGSAGSGQVYHVVFQTTTIGDTVIVYPEVFEANGQTGTVAPNAVVEMNNNLHYFSGTEFRSTGTKANIVNILANESTSQAIEPDIKKINLSAVGKASAVGFDNKIYWSLPIGSTDNSQIWVQDLARRGIWVMPWLIEAKAVRVFEDNTGKARLCVIKDNKILEFSRSVATQDDGVPFPTRLAGGGNTFDKSGISMAAVEAMRFKVLYPANTIVFNAYGRGEEEQVDLTGSEVFEQTASLTNYDDLNYEEANYDQDIGAVDFFSKALDVITVEVDEVLNEVSWEILTTEARCDYILASVFTDGAQINRAYYGET